MEIWSISQLEFLLSGSFSAESNLLFVNLLFNFNRDVEVCKAYILVSLSHVIVFTFHIANQARHNLTYQETHVDH